MKPEKTLTICHCPPKKSQLSAYDSRSLGRLRRKGKLSERDWCLRMQAQIAYYPRAQDVELAGASASIGASGPSIGRGPWKKCV